MKPHGGMLTIQAGQVMLSPLIPCTNILRKIWILQQMKHKGQVKQQRIKDKALVMNYGPARNEMLFSFRDFDQTQGQTFVEWENEKLLNPLLEKLKEYSKKTIPEAKQANFKPYGSFPQESGFKHPSFISKDANWASMHIKGKECIAGHLIDNIFYITFLDKDHQFYITRLKNT